MKNTPTTINRRKFMGFTAAGLAASCILPQSSWAGANDRITVGVIGVGRQSRFVNLKQFLNMPEVRVVAVCDVDAWRLDNAHKQVNDHYAKQAKSGQGEVCAAYSDFRDIIGREDIDAVMVATPDHWHVPISIAAVKAGKDVCCEKPLTLSIAEGRMLSDLVTQHKRVFRTDSEFRSLKVFHRFCELVVNGRIGEIHTIKTGVPESDVGCPPQPAMPVPGELDYPFWIGPAPMAEYTQKRVHPPHSYKRPGWMRVRDTCEGMITNWGAHLNDIAQWANGTERTGPVEVEGKGSYPKEGLWNVLLDFEVQYTYADGTKMYYETSYPYVRFEGSEGWIQANYGGRELNASSDSILNSEIGPDETHFRLKSDKQDFIDCVKTRGQTLEDAEVGHRTTSLCQIGHIAIQRGKRLEWDPDTETFQNDPEANKMLHRPMREPWTWDRF